MGSASVFRVTPAMAASKRWLYRSHAAISARVLACSRAHKLAQSLSPRWQEIVKAMQKLTMIVRIRKFAGAQCYQKCLWRCVRGCFAKLSPAAVAEAEHWNATASELESWQLEAKKEYNRLESEVSNSDSNADNTNKDGKSLEDRVEKLRKIVDYVEALKVAANKEKKSSMKLATIGNKAEEAVGV